jgi:hypothetical protein
LAIWSGSAATAADLSLRVDGRLQAFLVAPDAEQSRLPANLAGKEQLIVYPRDCKRTLW